MDITLPNGPTRGTLFGKGHRPSGVDKRRNRRAYRIHAISHSYHKTSLTSRGLLLALAHQIGCNPSSSPAILSYELCHRVVPARPSFIFRPSRSDCTHASLPCAPTLEIIKICLLPAESPGWWGLGSSSSSFTQRFRCR